MKAFPVSSQLKADEYRRIFDAAFAAPPPPPAAVMAALLLVRVGGDLLAVKRADITGFARGEHLTASPGRSPAFHGLAAVRGALVPVWNLARLLDRPQAADGALRWLVLAETRRDVPCAFACEAFEKMILVPEAALVAVARPEGARRFMSAIVTWNSTPVDVVDLPALQAELWRQNASS